MNIYFVNRFRTECTLFGNYVDELNAFLSSGGVQNVVVSIEFAKVKVFQSIQSKLLIFYIDFSI